MRITVLFNSGLDDRGQMLAAGGTYDVSEELALELLRIGRATRPAPPPKKVVETTVAPPVENTALRTSKPPPRKYK